MKGRLLQACSLRHSIKKGMLSVWGKLDLFKSNRGGVLPPPPPPAHLATRLCLMSIVLYLHSEFYGKHCLLL